MNFSHTLRWQGAGLLALAALLATTGCGESKAQKRQQEASAVIAMGEKYVREKVREPNAAQFRNQFIGKGGAPCGEVNAKDAFGAYLGYQRYISVARELTMLAQDMPPAEFEESWREMCR
ncbi:hypothetical protein ASF61_19720 [Duganella sp. Leaf126]|uniref:hypothetical protein n=1 Tax=Duganella sp. Leaf126 TaxID=1736266 RepID=UPI0006F85D76|nr:hypothetical protein [Duganella sp. Leaf126]KQQ45877.1 hypothetical protein ASF61_19720 [Duganella sp. Leaf126]